MRQRFISMCCTGEKCHCGRPAECKVEETIFYDDPDQFRHPLTSYLCHEHFRAVMGPAAGESEDKPQPGMYGALAVILAGPCGVGRTRGLIKGAPRGSTILGINRDHARLIDHEASVLCGRYDVRAVSIGAGLDNIRGQKGVYLLDHHTAETLLLRAETEIGKLRADLAEAEAKLASVTNILRTAFAGARTAKEAKSS